MDVLVQIKRLAVVHQVEFTLTAETERIRDGLTVEDVLESILNANAIKKVLRSRSAKRQNHGERLYVIESPTYAGIWVYTKGTIRRKGTLRRSFMSSSRQKSRTKKSVGKCPTCGSSRVVSVCEDVLLTIKGVRHRFESVQHERCSNCGERIFGIEVSQRFDREIGARRQRRHAA